MIIIEGMDGAGKSHLVDRLKIHFNMPVAQKSMSSDVKPLVDMKDWIEQTVKNGFQRVIYDRFALISGPIYAPIMNDQYQLEIYQNRNWMYDQHWQLIHKVNPIVVYCIPPLETVKLNLKEDPNNVKIIDYVDQLYVAYLTRAVLDINQNTSIIFDYTNSHDFERIIEFIGKALVWKGQR